VPYPVTFKAEYVEKRSRLTTFFRLILAIPHIIFLYFYGLAAGVVVIIAWFALLFTGRYPQGMYDFVAGALRYSTRVYGYLWLLTDEYPPFSGSAEAVYPVDLNIGAPKSEYSRLKVLFRIILAIPVLIIHYAMQIVAQVGAFIAWFAIVILGRQPKGLQDMIALGTSYQQRAYTYLALMTEDWPPFTDETTGGRVEAAPAFGALASSPPAAGPEHPTSVPPGGYASPEREAAFPSPSAPEPDPPTTLAEPAPPEAPATEPSFTVEPAESSGPEPPAPAPPPAAAPEPEPPPEPGGPAPTSGDQLGGGPSAPTSGDPLGGAPPPAAAPEPPAEPSPPSPGDWPDPEPEPGPPSPGDWPDPEPKPEPPASPRADDDEDEPPPGPFGPSSTNP
jgi:hypothetical protein